jgi:thiol-disulfide isomerase/thioredoxin
MSSFARSLQSLDQFRVVSKDLTKSTLTGGVFTAVAYAAVGLLLLAELGAFLRTTYLTNIIMDENRESLMQINFDITLYDLPCKFLQIGVFSKFGEEKLNTTDTFNYIPLDHTGQYKGMAYTTAEIAALEQADTIGDVTDEEKKELDSDWSASSDQFKHNDFDRVVGFHDFTFVNFYAEWCSHCRQFYPTWMEASNKINEKMDFKDGDGHADVKVKFLRMNCVDFQQNCNKVQIQAFPTLRLYKRDGSFEAYKDKRSVENIVGFLSNAIKNAHLIVTQHHAMFNEGCQVQGAMKVARVPGHFHLQAKPFGSQDINPALTNVSHIVNHLSFGDKETRTWAQRQNIPREMLGHINPLDGKKFVVEHFHEAPQHYLKVVSTHVQGKSNVFYQMTHTDRVRRLKEERSLTPQARFTYDFSPMSVVVKAKSKRWYEFLTSLFAILGGTYTVVELCSGAVDTVSQTVKDAMGKAN